MNRSVKFAIHQPNGFEPIFPVHRTERGHHHMIVRSKNPSAKRKWQAMLETIDLILVSIELYMHDICDSHSKSNVTTRAEATS